MRHRFSRFVPTAALLLALFPPTYGQEQTAATNLDNKPKSPSPEAQTGTKTNQPSKPAPESALIIFYSTWASPTEDIGRVTVPLAEEAMDAASSLAIGYRDLWAMDSKVNVYVDLQRMVGTPDADDIIRGKCLIVCRRFIGPNGVANIWPVDVNQRFRVISGGTDKESGKLKPPTKEQVRKEVLAYLEATSQPPPGSVSMLRIESERREMLAQANRGSGGTKQPNNVKVTSNK